ncbi:IclR family transcriptional regulator domain-containing protein [Tardiphaga sp. 20_F10_N6_6]|jgi:IclR family pca regulon transcriptional regulator|uniref:IclR family transcriptional regulator domain-containing protein n=1 Tax=Tardiphaga TaxID=1395974 RepID=UPI000B6A091D|nr:MULTISPECIES: IclR family transcriptional regulator C-terminal domain-containing protein [Tardiphaga]NUU42774.1 helix-turn-helix domain-containing protein [Tardiphaga robiniae]UFS75973.1 helix-turn-helix domain-containing protein [Tardiphaga sp. 37S4]SNT50283.1 transcriptional regulator, IclR family [Tardiphaga sp. OK246]
MAKDSDGFVRAIARGFAAVEALGRPPGRHTLSEVAAIAGLSRATARRMLATLIVMKYCEADGRYFSLRPRALGLGLSYLNALPYWGYAQRALEDLRNEIGESCSLAVLDETEIVYALRLPAQRILSANLAVGSRLPAHVVSLGRVLLAALPPDQRAHYLATTEFKHITPRTITDPVLLERELERVEAKGYGWVDGELDPAICGIAVPVRDHGGRVVAAISVNAISGTMDEATAKEKYLIPLRRTAQDIRTQSFSTG